MQRTLLTIMFALCIHQSFSQCVGTQSATVSPPPILGSYYYAGDTVTFCYTMQNFNQLSANWFHGVTLSFGPGWDTSTLIPISVPAGCDAQGVWGWYAHDTSANTGFVYGIGFYYDSPSGSPLTLLDTLPGNNYGDNCTSYVWTFCFSIQVNSNCAGGDSLWVTALATADGTSGSWTFNTCLDPPFYILDSVVCAGQCAASLIINFEDPPCYGDSVITNVMVINGTPPFTYLWLPGGQTSDTVNLSAGENTVIVTDSLGCLVTDSVNILTPAQLIANAGIDTTVCFGYYLNLGGNPTATGGTSPYQYSWTIDPDSVSNPLILAQISTSISVTVTDAQGCTASDTMMLTVEKCTGIFSPEENYSVGIFPNPNDGLFVLNVEERMVNAGNELIVYDVLGQEVYRRNIIAAQENLDLTDVSNGIYQVLVKSGKFSIERKIVKQQ